MATDSAVGVKITVDLSELKEGLKIGTEGIRALGDALNATSLADSIAPLTEIVGLITRINPVAGAIAGAFTAVSLGIAAIVEHEHDVRRSIENINVAAVGATNAVKFTNEQIADLGKHFRELKLGDTLDANAVIEKFVRSGANSTTVIRGMITELGGLSRRMGTDVKGAADILGNAFAGVLGNGDDLGKLVALLNANELKAFNDARQAGHAYEAQAALLQGLGRVTNEVQIRTDAYRKAALALNAEEQRSRVIQGQVPLSYDESVKHLDALTKKLHDDAVRSWQDASSALKNHIETADEHQKSIDNTGRKYDGLAAKIREITGDLARLEAEYKTLSEKPPADQDAARITRLKEEIAEATRLLQLYEQIQASQRALSHSGAASPINFTPGSGGAAAPSGGGPSLFGGGQADVNSAGGGFDVPDDQLAFIHKNEVVLPAELAAPFRVAGRLLAGEGESGTKGGAGAGADGGDGGNNIVNFAGAFQAQLEQAFSAEQQYVSKSEKVFSQLWEGKSQAAQAGLGRLRAALNGQLRDEQAQNEEAANRQVAQKQETANQLFAVDRLYADEKAELRTEDLNEQATHDEKRLDQQKATLDSQAANARNTANEAGAANQTAANEIGKAWQAAGKQVEQALSTALHQSITTGQVTKNQLVQLADQTAIAFGDAALHILTNWIFGESSRTAATDAGNAERAKSDEAAASKSEAASKAAAEKQVADAKVTAGQVGKANKDSASDVGKIWQDAGKQIEQSLSTAFHQFITTGQVTKNQLVQLARQIEAVFFDAVLKIVDHWIFGEKTRTSETEINNAQRVKSDTQAAVASEAAQKKSLDKLVADTKTADKQVETTNKTTATDIDKIWQNTGKQIEQALSTTFHQFITTGQITKNQLIQLANQIESAFISAALQILNNWLFTETSRTAATQTGNALRTADSVAASATTKVVNSATAVDGITSDAAKAASGAYKAVVDIPIVGPILAPAAAAAAFAAVIAFKSLVSAAGGFDVPEDQLAFIHKNEVVLPASLAAPFRVAGAALASGQGLNLGGGGGGGGPGTGDIHVHMTAYGNLPAYMIESQGKTIARTLAREMRNFNPNLLRPRGV